MHFWRVLRYCILYTTFCQYVNTRDDESINHAHFLCFFCIFYVFFDFKHHTDLQSHIPWGASSRRCHRGPRCGSPGPRMRPAPLPVASGRLREEPVNLCHEGHSVVRALKVFWVVGFVFLVLFHENHRYLWYFW